MACVDAIWRVHIQNKQLQTVQGGILDLFKILRPKDSRKLATKPTYRMLNDGFHHLLEAEILVCWEKVSDSLDVQTFVDGAPTWQEICTLSKQIRDIYLARASFEALRANDSQSLARDYLEENKMLFRHDAMLYCVLVHAMNTGAVGVMEDLLWLWVPIFHGCGKHKYTAHLSKFMRNLRDVYPPCLSQVVRMHWLCNPTGAEDGFRGIDWLVERNNLYTKVTWDSEQVYHDNLLTL